MPFSLINLPNYHILNKVYESDNSVVYRGQRRKDGCAVILKILKGDYPSLAALVRYQQAYEITHSLNLTSVVKAYALEKYQNTLVMVLEDFGGQSLKQLLRVREFSLAELLTIFIQIVNSLGEIHAANIIHKDINPSNIIYNLLTQQLKIIDFGISSVLPRETPALKNPDQIEGTLHYMSPEQTGRMNRTIDYRTDFYALGVTFYEMLTHRLPFESSDTLGLVHCHLAKQPPLPHLVNVKVPVMLSAIVMKLMDKVAEARYQSTFGIKADLENCLAQLQVRGKIESFSLGQRDISDKFQLPQKLYGRVQEKQILLQAFDRVSQGHSEILMISGYSGIGKTTLVQEIYRPLTYQVGYFIAGKFEQLQRNIPYSAVISALAELVKQLLTESEEQLKQWREQFLAVLGANTQVIVEVIPEIEFIVGKQPAVAELPLTQARNRFNLVFQNFIKLFTRPEHPLVMFLDNLQWADAASLKLLKLLATATGKHHLFIIGAYRDNEVDVAHPLSKTLAEIQEAGMAIEHIRLSPLTFYDVSQLIAETFNTTPDTVGALAEVVLAKNQGNPLFIKEFLQLLYNEKLIYFVYPTANVQWTDDTETTSGNWEWDLVRIQSREVTDNVVELLADRIQKLSANGQRLLQLAACIGNQFSLQMLVTILQKSSEEIVNSIQEAVFEGLLLPLESGQLAITQYQLSILQDEIAPLSVDDSLNEYKFSHERIRQAAYFLIADEPKQIIHQQIANLLLQETPPEQLGKRIFDIVNQFNLALSFIENQTERNELAKLNLLAGQKAKASAAFEPALRYTVLGLELLGESAWQQQYDLALQLTVEASELAYLVGDFAKTDNLVDTVLAQAKNLPDKLKVYEIRMQAYKAQSKSREAVELGLSVLVLLGIKFPKTPNKLDFLLGLMTTRIALLGKSIKSLGNLPNMTNSNMLAAMRIMLSISPAVYAIMPKLLPLIVFKRILLSIKYGNTYESIPAYASYGYILCAVEENIENGYEFGRLALQLLEQADTKELQARVLQIVHGIITPYKEHINITLKPLLEGYQSGLETGNFEYAAMSISTYITHSYFVGKELTTVENEITTYTEAFTRLNQRNSLAINQVYRQAILNLREPQPKYFPPLRLLGEAYNEEIMLPLHQQAKERSLIFQVYLQKLILCYLFQAFPEAYQNALLAGQYLDAVIGSPIVPLFHFYDSLAHLALFSEASKTEKDNILQRITKNQRKMQKWAHHAPMNYLHKFYLVEAEQAHILHQDGTARELYDRAIVLAQQNEYVNEEALACELAGKFYLDKKQTKIAQVYLWDAHHGYSRWGAFTKVKDLETRYSRILSQSNLQKTTVCPLVLNDKSYPECRTCSLASSTTGYSTVSTPKQSSPNVLDLTSVLKVSQVIAGEIKLKNLLEKLMKVVVENAGAQTGFLLLNRADTWVIEAKATISTLFTPDIQSEWQVETLQSTILTDSEELSAGIVHYVARTKEYIVLNDAAKTGHFTNDLHVLKRQPKSILCAPLINQGHITAVFYLENNLATGVFTPNRIEMLNLLSSQMAIAIENARLYASLEEKVRERTKDIEAKNVKLLELNEKLVKLNQDKDEFLGIAAHDLKNPLAAIQGLANMIEMDFDDMSKEEIIDLANMIQISSKQMFELIMNLLNVNSIESGKIQLSLYKLDVLPILRWIINQYTERAKAKNIRLGFQYAQEIYHILGDEGTLRQILDNLVSNAVKYSLHDKNIFVRLSKNRQWVRCEVQDEGPGLSEADRCKLFGKFTRLTPQPTGDENSTGLGLFIVKKLVEALNGEVWCESELGYGSTFIVEFPRLDSV